MREDDVLKAILDRERLIHALSRYAAAQHTTPHESDQHLDGRDVTSVLLELKAATVVVVEASRLARCRARPSRKRWRSAEWRHSVAAIYLEWHKLLAQNDK